MKMRHITILLVVVLLLGNTVTVQGQSRWRRALSSAVKTYRASTITDEELAEYVSKGVRDMDRKNTIYGPGTTYGKRLARLTRGMKDANGIKLNFKVYKTSDINAFACPDGSVRVFSALMDILSDNELLLFPQRGLSKH